MDWKRLRRLAGEVDDEHREAMRTIHEDLGDAIFGADDQTRASRRRFLQGLGLGGTVLTVGATSIALASAAGAQTSTTTGGPTTTGAPTTTTTLPPKQPSAEDLVILSFAQSLELAVFEIYALALPKLGPDLLVVAGTFASHHRQHGQAMAGLAGKAALNVANQSLLAELTPLIDAANDETGALKVLFQVETAAASAYVAALGQLVGTNGATVVASIQPIEARHAVVLGQALDLGLDELSPTFEDTNKAPSPAEYPIVKR